MTTRPSHVCLIVKSLTYSRDGQLVSDSACAVCGNAARAAVPVTGKQLRLWISKERSER